MSVYGKTEFIQLVGITESELKAIIENHENIPKLINLMKADGNTDLVTDMGPIEDTNFNLNDFEEILKKALMQKYFG